MFSRFEFARCEPAVTGPEGYSEHDPFVKAASLVTNRQKYVNMADIIFSQTGARGAASTDVPGSAEGEPIWDLIELLFFAYRDFVSDPDHVLEKFGFGRAHHRVLHFVGRRPGITVGDLLGILGITKQSLARVLTPLMEEDYVVQATGRNDRRTNAADKASVSPTRSASRRVATLPA